MAMMIIHAKCVNERSIRVKLKTMKLKVVPTSLLTRSSPTSDESLGPTDSEAQSDRLTVSQSLSVTLSVSL